MGDGKMPEGIERAIDEAMEASQALGARYDIGSEDHVSRRDKAERALTPAIAPWLAIVREVASIPDRETP